MEVEAYSAPLTPESQKKNFESSSDSEETYKV